MRNSTYWYRMASHEIASRPIWVLLPAAVQGLLAVMAIPSGALSLAVPNGRLLGAQFIAPYPTRGLPFIHDFVPVGIWLIAVYGALPLLFDAGPLKRARLAWILTAVLGLSVVAWIVVEITLFAALGSTPHYPLIGGIGAATVILSLVPSVRRYYPRR